MRRLLDALYGLSGALSALFIALICLIVSAQVALNLLTRLFGTAVSYTIPSYADFAGFFLAAASFLGLAYTLVHGGHIRVTLLISRFAPAPRLISELFSLAVGGLLSGFASYYMIRLTIESWQYGDLSYGIVAIPIWIPQTAVSAGLVILTIAFADLFLGTLRARAPVLRGEERE